MISCGQPRSRGDVLSRRRGRAPGARLANPDLARTLRSDRGSRAGPASTRGRWPPRWCASRKSNGGFFTPAISRRKQASWGEPLDGRYRDVTIFKTPPPTQGFAVLEMLNLLEPLELHRKAFLGPDHVHLLVQAKQIAYHDRDQRARRSRFCRRAGRAADLEALRRRARPADRLRCARCHGTRCRPSAACPATRSISPRSIATATRPR